MPESPLHAGLVVALIDFATEQFGGLTNVSVKDDSVRPLRGERPPRINGYVPDLYAINVPTTSTLIGEAKTRGDLETDHTRLQINAFLAYLAQTQNGVFALSVPLTAAATARRLLADAKRAFPGSETRTLVLDGVRVTPC
jgi:hypothetical protein